MDNKMKKSKYAALVLASTMALSTVVTAAPQAFDNNAITAHAEEATPISSTDNKITIGGKEYTISYGTADTKTTLKAGEEEAIEITDGEDVTIGSKKYTVAIILPVTDEAAVAGSVTLTEKTTTEPGTTEPGTSVSVGDNYSSTTTGTGDAKKTTLTVEGVEYDVTISGTTAKLKDAKNKETTVENGKVSNVNGLNVNVQVTIDSVVLTVIEQQTAGSVTEEINDLDVTSKTYADDVKTVKNLFDLLTKDEQAKVRNKDLLTAHDKYATTETADTTALKAAFPTESAIKALTKYSTTDKAIDTVEETVKGKIVKRVTNKELEAYVVTLKDFDDAMKKVTDKNEKKIFAERAKEGKTLLKLAQTQQKVVAASGEVEYFNDVYTVVTKGGKFTTSATEITVKNSKFKIDNDAYELKDGTGTNAGKYILVGPLGEKVLELTDSKAEFTIENKDTATDQATTDDKYTVEKKNSVFVVTKQVETHTLESKIPVLKFDSKMSVNAYKTLKAGTKKYTDAQIEAISALSSTYKSLTSDGKKQITKAQVAKLKQYEKSLKAQETLEKKLVAEDSKGVTKLISSLKYGADYATSIEAARTAYDGLTPKFQKKIKSSVVAKLKDHEAAIDVITAIEELPTENLLLAKATDEAATTTGLAVLEAAIKEITTGKNGTTGTYDKLTKSQKSLVKNYKDLATLQKQITSQKDYLLKTNNDLIVAWQKALEKVTKTTDVKILNNQFAIGTDIYTLSYDKTAKKSTIKKDDTVVEITATGKDTAEKTLTDAAKGNATGTFTVDGANYQLTAAKGKFKVDKLTATEAEKALDVYTFTTTTDISANDAKVYTADEAKLITDATTAYEAVAKVKAAKAFVNKDDVTAYNAYVKALKAQKALEVKDLAKAKILLNGKTVEVEAGKGTDKEKILVALKAFTDADKNKFIKGLTVDSLTVANKKLTIKVDDTTNFEMTVKEKPSADEVTAKAAIDGKTVKVAKDKLTDKTTVLAAIKALKADNTVLTALTTENIEIASGKATVTLPSGDKAIVTIEEQTAA